MENKNKTILFLLLTNAKYCQPNPNMVLIDNNTSLNRKKIRVLANFVDLFISSKNDVLTNIRSIIIFLFSALL